MTPGTDPRALVREVGGAELLERLSYLDTVRSRPPRAPVRPLAPAAGERLDYDVLLAGGGLSLLLAPVLADHGLRVAVADRGRVGAVHREWNASEAELAPLWESGLFTREEVAGLVVARYREGVCQWHRGRPWPVTGVLDRAVDAGRLLAEVRRRAEARGVHLLDHRAVVGERAGPGGLAVTLESPGGEQARLTCQVMVDARGAASPHSGADLVCPTVGGVLEGLETGHGPRQVDPGVGEILVTTEDVEAGRQHIWEGFPGRPGQTTVYLFYYALAGREGRLVDLYARFFATLPRYKRGAARLVRPTFGYIPGWSRLSSIPRVPPRVVLFGDAAARHSPLTYCGFGHMLRTFLPAAWTLAEGLSEGRLRGSLEGDAGIHAGTGALSWLMSRPPPGHALNALLDAAFGTLHEMGEGPYRDLLLDRMDPAAFFAFLTTTARKHPKVYAEVLASLGPVRAARWGLATALRGWRMGSGPVN